VANGTTFDLRPLPPTVLEVRGAGVRRSTAWLAVTGGAVIASLALVPVAANASLPGPEPSATPKLLTTPLLSPGRLPLTLQELWAGRALTAALDNALSPAALGAAAARASCAEVVQDGQVLYQYHAHRPVLPASNMKLLTATALLDQLGPAYTFTTTVVAPAAPVDGVVQGNLYLVGGGDPLLRLPSYAASVVDGGPIFTNVTGLVTRLKAAGVREVTGSVLGDERRYDSVRGVASWPASYRQQGDVGPLSAVGIDDGFALAGAAVPASDPPPVQSAGVLTDLLRSAGIVVDGEPGAGTAPAGARVLARLVSPPLRQVLREVLRESDNTAMELLTKELGLRVSGTGSTAAGVAAVRADLAADGLPMEGFVNVDGSGLSRSDRVTCALLAAALQRAGQDGTMVQDLPVAGESGTLADELKGTIAAGRVDAKTGTLNGVKALSGWVQPVAGQSPGNPMLASPVVFASVLNDLSLSVANPAALTDRVALDLAQYPQAPALAMFEPG
jgi:D-alanyl-D-alanine carboxypeptidase/D-alanyl-D-alanine-endopeptidase (penicillin-binding protein 4)